MSKFIKSVKSVFTSSCIAAGALIASSLPAHAEGLGDLGSAANFSDGKTAITAVAVGLGGFLVFGLVAKSILGFFKRV